MPTHFECFVFTFQVNYKHFNRISFFLSFKLSIKKETRVKAEYESHIPVCCCFSSTGRLDTGKAFCCSGVSGPYSVYVVFFFNMLQL